MQKLIAYLTITLFAGYILFLNVSGKLNFYIHPRYTDFAVTMSYITLGFCLLYAGYSLQQMRQQPKISLKLVLPGFKTVFVWLPLMAVLGLGFLLPVQPLSTATAQQRAVDLNSLRSGEISTADLFIRNTRNYSIGDWIVALNNNPNFENYVGKQVKLSGFIFSPEEKSTEFYISRFAITCCAVDARPLGLKVIYDWTNNFKQNQWVEVEGEFTQVGDGNSAQLIITPAKVSEIAIPNQPYIF